MRLSERKRRCVMEQEPNHRDRKFIMPWRWHLFRQIHFRKRKLWRMCVLGDDAVVVCRENISCFGAHSVWAGPKYVKIASLASHNSGLWFCHSQYSLQCRWIFDKWMGLCWGVRILMSSTENVCFITISTLSNIESLKIAPDVTFSHLRQMRYRVGPYAQNQC